jgi:hypothetical protein
MDAHTRLARLDSLGMRGLLSVLSYERRDAAKGMLLGAWAPVIMPEGVQRRARANGWRSTCPSPRILILDEACLKRAFVILDGELDACCSCRAEPCGTNAGVRVDESLLTLRYWAKGAEGSRKCRCAHCPLPTARPLDSTPTYARTQGPSQRPVQAKSGHDIRRSPWSDKLQKCCWCNYCACGSALRPATPPLNKPLRRSVMRR